MISIAIDGPSGAGKSSLAKRLAAELGYVYVDTGAMYRAIGLYTLRAGQNTKDAAAVAALLPDIHLDIRPGQGAQQILLNGEDVTETVRQEQVGMAASDVSAHPAVRAFLLETQRALAARSNVLMDGRDIGTVVLPDATVKIFLTATPEARAQRRLAELPKGRRPTTPPFWPISACATTRTPTAPSPRCARPRTPCCWTPAPSTWRKATRC